MPVKHRTIPPLTAKDKRRFRSKVQKGKPDECWEWMAHKRNGYGAFKFDSHLFIAPRIAWTLAHGPIPPGLCVLHHCDNSACCNPGPKHLFLGTLADNNHDRDRKGRQVAPCGERNGSHTHPECWACGEAHWAAKLTEQDIRDIRRRYAAGGISTYALAREYGVSHHTIWKIVHRTSWKHVA